MGRGWGAVSARLKLLILSAYFAFVVGLFAALVAIEIAAWP
jgi:hypothetical protein